MSFRGGGTVRSSVPCLLPRVLSSKSNSDRDAVSLVEPRLVEFEPHDEMEFATDAQATGASFTLWDGKTGEHRLFMGNKFFSVLIVTNRSLLWFLSAPTPVAILNSGARKDMLASSKGTLLSASGTRSD